MNCNVDSINNKSYFHPWGVSSLSHTCPLSLSSRERLGSSVLAEFFLRGRVCVYAQSCPTFCDPMDCSLPGSSVHGISQARILEWLATSFSRGSSQPRDQALVSSISCNGGGFITTIESQAVRKQRPRCQAPGPIDSIAAW